MQIKTLHVPERLPDEPFERYQARRRWSHFFARQTRVVTALPMQHRCDAMRANKRRIVRAIGVRQYKRKMRALKDMNV